jgi:hypothetical protein
MNSDKRDIISEIRSQFGEKAILYHQPVKDETPTIWVDKNKLTDLLFFLKKL